MPTTTTVHNCNHKNMDNSYRDHLRPAVSREAFDDAPKWVFHSWKRLASACRPMAQAQNKGDLQQFLSETPKSLSRPLEPLVESRVFMYGETFKVWKCSGMCQPSWCGIIRKNNKSALPKKKKKVQDLADICPCRGHPDQSPRGRGTTCLVI